MSEDKKRLEELNATIDRAVEHLHELYDEKKKLEEKLFDWQGHIQVQTLQMAVWWWFETFIYCILGL